jgi:hypothetical protein
MQISNNQTPTTNGVGNTTNILPGGTDATEMFEKREQEKKERAAKMKNRAVVFILLTVVGIITTGAIVQSKKVPNFLAFITGFYTSIGIFSMFFERPSFGGKKPPLLEVAFSSSKKS